MLAKAIKGFATLNVLSCVQSYVIMQMGIRKNVSRSISHITSLHILVTYPLLCVSSEALTLLQYTKV